MLGVCRESRTIALQHYRLCFGTTNIYADLDKDILLFGDWNHTELEGDIYLWGWYSLETDHHPNENSWRLLNLVVMEDLEQVTRIGYSFKPDYDLDHDEYEKYIGEQCRALKKDLARFKSLKEVLLSHTYRSSNPCKWGPNGRECCELGNCPPTQFREDSKKSCDQFAILQTKLVREFTHGEMSDMPGVKLESPGASQTMQTVFGRDRLYVYVSSENTLAVSNNFFSGPEMPNF